MKRSQSILMRRAILAALALAAGTTQAQIALNPGSRVTAVTSKPGFLWRVFNNTANQANTNQRTEDALAGLLKDAEGNLLLNNADPLAQGVALAPAEVPADTSAPLLFEIDTVINLNQTGEGAQGTFTPDGQMPGIPGTDGSTDGTAAEIITYLELAAGTYTMGVASDDGFRTAAGNLKDAFQGAILGEFNGGRGTAETLFSFTVTAAGVYPFRTSYEEGGGGSDIEWYSVLGDGTKVLINDVANGGIKAYRAATTAPQPPYIQSVVPGPAPRQLNVVSSAVVVVLSDGATVAIDDATVDFKVDGKPVTNKVRAGGKITLTYVPDGLQFPNESHTAALTFKGSDGTTRTESWSFRNLKNVVLPAPVLTENFDSTEEGKQPAGWNPWNFTVDCEFGGEDITAQRSDTYENWVVITPETANPAIDDYFMDTVNPTEKVNGAPLTLEMLRSGKFLYAESDSRCNGTNVPRPATEADQANYGQIQFIATKPFNLSAVNNPVLSYMSGYVQNQDSYGGTEYSVDGGATWLPVAYFLDGPDIVVKADGTVDGEATLKNNQGDTALWVDNGVQKGNSYGDAVGAPINAAIGDYIVPRVNDDGTEGKRIEIFRLPAAANKADVRLRFSATGSDSWYWFVDNIAFYDVAPPVSGPTVTATPPAGLSGTPLTNVTVGNGTITADIPAGDTQGYLTITPAVTITSVKIENGKLVITYQ